MKQGGASIHTGDGIRDNLLVTERHMRIVRLAAGAIQGGFNNERETGDAACHGGDLSGVINENRKHNLRWAPSANLSSGLSAPAQAVVALVAAAKDPLLIKTYMVILSLVIITLALHMNWLRKHPNSASLENTGERQCPTIES